MTVWPGLEIGNSSKRPRKCAQHDRPEGVEAVYERQQHNDLRRGLRRSSSPA